MSNQNTDLSRWQAAVDFHGHICPGISVGYKASLYGLKLLDLEGKNIRTSHYAIVENDVCGVDGVQLITGCTIGNDSLIIDNQGKKAFIFVDKKTGQGVRVLLDISLWNDNGEAIILHHKVKKGTATSEEKSEFFRIREKRGLELLEIPDEEMFTWQAVNIKVPSSPRLFNFITCEICNEAAMEPWIKIQNGLKVCSKCSY